MKKIIVALCLVAACFVDTSCSKKADSGCSDVSVASEDATMFDQSVTKILIDNDEGRIF